MQSTQDKYLLIKNTLPILTHLSQPPKSIIYLAGQKCAISFLSSLLIVDLNQRRNHPQQLISLPNIQYMYPVGEGLCCVVSNKQDNQLIYILVNKERKQITVSQWEPEYSRNIVIPFYSSGLLMVLGEEWGYIVDSVSNVKPISLGCENYDKIDDISCIVNGLNPISTIRILDIQSRDRRSIQIPQQFQKFQPFITNFHLINNDLAIYSLQIQKQKQSIIGILQISPSGTFQHILIYQKNYRVNFSIMNPQLNILMFSLKQSSVQEKINNDSKTVVFNYKLKRVVLELEERLFKFDPRRVSARFNHFLGEIQGNKEERVIVDYVPVNIKKLYMFLIKEGEIEKMFGNMMVRQVLKVVL